MNKIVKHDDGNLIWFNYDDIDWKSLNESGLSHFDIENIPTKSECHNFLGIYEPVVMSNNTVLLSNFYVTYFRDSKSKTGYSCMCLNKDRAIYKSKAGYNNEDKPASIEF